MSEPSVWPEGASSTDFPQLHERLRADVVIVGGGITGVVAAYLLAKEGKSVVMLEKGRVGSGMTRYTTAHVTQVTDALLSELARRFGENRAALAWRSGAAAIDLLERIIDEEGIECEFVRCPAYVFARDEEGVRLLRDEAALAGRLGFDARFVAEDGLGLGALGYMGVEAQAKFHPLKFVVGLARRTAEMGVRFYENSPVTTYEAGETKCVTRTAHGAVASGDILLTTHVPLGDPKLISMRIDAFQSYVLELNMPSGTLAEGIYWDTARPYHYFRVDRLPTCDRVIIGGEDHRTGQGGHAGNPYVQLKSCVSDLFHDQRPTVAREWSGEILETPDGLPYIGEVSPHLYVATGYAGTGMSFGVLAASLLCDGVMGRTSEAARLYAPNRWPGLARLGTRLCSVAKGMIGARLANGPQVSEVLPGCGAVVRMGGRQVAAYRGPGGELLRLSPVCTHMGCIVQWNDAGKSWDCPCHGSRFTPEGEVLHGPAEKPLERLA